MFLFHNELDLLELRLKTLNDAVDLFVLVESPQTFSGRAKPLHYEKNLARFEPWAHKIRHVSVPHIGTDNAWDREHQSRDYMLHGLWDAEPDDLVFQSDCDEIWNPDLKSCLVDHFPTSVYLMFHAYYALNAERRPRVAWRGTRRCRFRDWPGGQALREIRNPTIRDAGWHFSFLGDAEHAREKMRAFSHTEYSDEMFTDVKRLERCISGGYDPIHPTARYKPVLVDSTFPKPLLAEPERWAKFLRPVPTEAV